jgi:hypothetical protein
VSGIGGVGISARGERLRRAILVPPQRDQTLLVVDPVGGEVALVVVALILLKAFG